MTTYSLSSLADTARLEHLGEDDYFETLDTFRHIEADTSALVDYLCSLTEEEMHA